MTTPLPPSPRALHPDFEHAALFHDGTEEFAELLAPHVSDAVRAGEAVLVCTDEPSWVALRDAVGPGADAVRFVSDDLRYGKPTEAMKIVHDFVQEALRFGAPAAWSIGAIPFDGRRDDDWMRYEAAVNDVLAHLPFKGICTYDLTSCAPHLVEAAGATHPTSFGRAGRRDSIAFDTSGWSASRIPIPDGAPALSTTPDTPADARHSVRAALAGDLPLDALDDLQIVVSELVTNAHLHGVAPVELAVWVAGDGWVVAVSDHGAGITDPFFELRPPTASPGGAGLWIVGQLVDCVGIDRSTGRPHTVVASVAPA